MSPWNLYCQWQKDNEVKNITINVNTMKKIFGILSLLLCATPMIYAQANGVAKLQSSDVVTGLNGVAKGKVIDSGSCGYNVNYELYDDYTLRIYGKGEMSNYLSLGYFEGEVNPALTSSPWGKEQCVKKIKAVVIENGVTRIGKNAFSPCTSLTAVTIPNSVTSIGDEAFRGCSALTDITIPNGVTSIGWATFCGCEALKKINIPNSVTFIEYMAFDGCSSLAEVTISNNIETLTSSVFYGCSSLAHIKIPNSVTSIEEFAFENCSSLSEINIPNSVTSIGDRTFYYCDKLKYVKIGENVTEIGGMAFPQDDDEDLVIEITSETPANLGSVEAFGFLCTIYVPENALETYLNAKYWKDHAYQILPKKYTTGINSIGSELSEKKTAIYDLQGHRVTEMQPNGIYIVNGKKIVMK